MYGEMNMVEGFSLDCLLCVRVCDLMYAQFQLAPDFWNVLTT